MTFRELFILLEQRLGEHHFPINHAATDIRNLFADCPIYDSFIKDLARGIYKANHCHHLGSKIDEAATQMALQNARKILLESANIDVETYLFTEDLCVAIHDLMEPKSDRPTRTPPAQPKGQIIALEDFRHPKRTKS